MPYCDTECFEVFLNELSKQQPDEYKILFLDNGAFHKSIRLTIPNNIALCFLPPYSPELNPAEKVWAFLKKKLTNKAFEKLEDLQKFMDNRDAKLELALRFYEEFYKRLNRYEYLTKEV
jgi:transposase